MACITPQSREILGVYQQGRLISGDGASALFGPDLSMWPARWFDAVTVLELERRREEAARIEAETSE